MCVCVLSVKYRADPNKQNRRTKKTKRVTCVQHFIPPFVCKSILNSTLHTKLLKYLPLAAFRLASHSHSKRNNNQSVKKCVLGKVCADVTSKCRNAASQFYFSLHEKFNDDFFSKKKKQKCDIFVMQFIVEWAGLSNARFPAIRCICKKKNRK